MSGSSEFVIPFSLFALGEDDVLGVDADVILCLCSDHDDKEAQLAGVLSPISKKKTGRAYVALARAHSEK